MEVFDITNPRYNEQISPDPWHAVKSRFHCTWLDTDLAQLMLTFQEPIKLPVKFYIVQQKRYSDQSNLRCGCCIITMVRFSFLKTKKRLYYTKVLKFTYSPLELAILETSILETRRGNEHARVDGINSHSRNMCWIGIT